MHSHAYAHAHAHTDAHAHDPGRFFSYIHNVYGLQQLVVCGV